MLESDTTAIILYLLTGSFAGFSAGLLGIGGGLIIVPALFFIFSLQPYDTQYVMHMALATSLATIITTSISSTLAHHKKRAVLWPVVIILSPGICAGAWLGAHLASQLEVTILKPAFGLFELFVAALMLNPKQNKPDTHRQHPITIKPLNAISGGGFIGMLSAMVGIGGGTLTVPFLHWHHVAIKKAIATSAACGLPIALFATASYLYSSLQLTEKTLSSSHSFGFIQLDAFFLIAVSSFIFAPVGANTAHKLHGKHLRQIFAGVLILLGLKMLFF